MEAGAYTEREINLSAKGFNFDRRNREKRKNSLIMYDFPWGTMLVETQLS